jgi:photosystem II stability/assembly factor-like uncharacterized protein
MARVKRRAAKRTSAGKIRAVRRPAKAARQPRVVLLVGTRKGAFVLHGNASRTRWRSEGPHRFGEIVNHIVLDPRDRRTLLCAARAGHLGPTIFRSTDLGVTWQEASAPPAFRKAPEGESGFAVGYTMALAPGSASEPGVWYAGTSPPALFRSEDAGATWHGVDGWNENPLRTIWCPPEDQTPDGSMLHSILIDPRDASHIYVGCSGGGSFESGDAGASWRPLNAGVEAAASPVLFPEYGQDPHNMALHPLQPDRLYQQNHCGIYRLDRPATQWERVGKSMPADVGDIGFPIVLHPRDPDTIWVFPMDGSTVWPRVSPGGKPAVYRSRDAGKSWERQQRGLPSEHGWYTVKRQAFSADACAPVGLYFGTTGGELWMSASEGRSWRQIAAHLPHIYSVAAATLD